MKEVKFRRLTADEIEVRPAMIKDGKATMLLYIDSRSVGRLLDETVGPMGWTMEFTDVNGQVVGKMGIWDEEKGQWVYKCDTGSESNIEAQKGLFSDCYKRCLSRWGVNELYTAPRIVIPDDGYGCSGYSVVDIRYDDCRRITKLVIVDKFHHQVFNWSADGRSEPVDEHKDLEWTPDNTETLKAFCGALKGKVDTDELKKFYAFYEKRCKEWKNRFEPDKLWERWKTTARS